MPDPHATATAEYDPNSNSVLVWMPDGTNFPMDPQVAEDLMIDIDNAVSDWHGAQEE